MKTLEELKLYYEQYMLPDLNILEQKRKNIKKKLLPFILLAALFFATTIIIMAKTNAGLAFLAIPVILTIAIFIGWHYVFFSEFLDEFKDSVIQKIVHFFDPSLVYSKNEFISKSEFLKSKIFTLRPDRYKGDDLVYGKIGKTQFSFSELDAKHVEHTSSVSGSNRRRETKTYPIFKGLFFVADFNKHFKGSTVVLPDLAQKLFGRLGQKLQSWNINRGKLIKLEDPEFEKLYVVYGDDQIESRYILSSSLMKRIVDFKIKSNKQIYLSFVASKLYVAIEYSRSLFEPSLFKSMLDFTQIREYYEDLQLAIGIIEDLNLNTRIWSKQ